MNHLKRFPHYKQHNASDCGPTSLRMIAKFYGMNYSVGVGKVMGSKQYPKSRLLRKIEQGDRNIYQEYVSFCHYKGKILRGLLKRRRTEYALFYIP